MADTLHRPTAEGETRHELRFLHGIDLAGEHRRPPRFDRTRIILALAAIVIIAAVVAVLLTRGGAELEQAAETPVAPEAVAPAAIPHVTAPNRPVATDQIVPDLSGLRIVQPRPETDQRPAATDLIVLDRAGLEPQIDNLSPGDRPAATGEVVLDTSGLPPIVPAAPGTPGEILPI